MFVKPFCLFLVIVYFKLVYSENLNSLRPDILKSDDDLNETEKINSKFVRDLEFGEESNKFKEDSYNHSQITEPEQVIGNYMKYYYVESFYLYTRDYHNGKDREVLTPLNASSLNNSHLKQKPIYILVHGFGGNGSLEWIINLKEALLQKEDCNIVSFDWPAGNKTGSSLHIALSYYLAQRKVSTVGNETAIFIESLIKHVDLTLNSVHCIGHSLGAHVCGFMGKPLKGRIGRITGLDPAGPFYRGYDASARLDKSDSLYVDVIHTDACVGPKYCYGLNETIGHSDFFPNGGMNQPGCPLVKNDAAGCSHVLSYKYFIASLDFNQSSTYFLARPCKNWKQYQEGNCSCGEKFQYMGFYAKPDLHGSFYLKTLAKPPYAMQDKGCISVTKSSDTSYILINFILGVVGTIMMNVVFIIYLKRNGYCSSPTNNEEDPLLGSKKASQ